MRKSAARFADRMKQVDLILSRALDSLSANGVTADRDAWIKPKIPTTDISATKWRLGEFMREFPSNFDFDKTFANI